MKLRLGAIALAGVAIVAVSAHHSGGSSGERFPQPVGEEPGEREADFAARRAAFIESMHRHAPGVDWRAQDARFRTARRERLVRERDAMADPLRVETPALTGTWSERGSSNQAGRVTAVMHDQQFDRLTVLSHGGNVWRAGRATLDWASTNDAVRFGPYYIDGFAERLGGLSNERLLVVSDHPAGVYRSDDAGATWQAASGLSQTSPDYASGLAVRDPSGAEVYFMRVEFDGGTGRSRPRVFASSDRGASFTSLGFVGQSGRASIFSPRYISGEVFVLADAELIRIVPGTNALSPVSTVPVGVSSDKVVLRGGFANGQPFLYAFYSHDATGQTEVFRSLDGGQTWTARTPAPTRLFSANSAETSPRDPNVLFAGGINLYRSADGGLSWTLVNDWTEYYANPSTRLHADIASVSMWIDNTNVERLYVGTDGGLFESRDNGVTVQNLGNGLRDSQYYGSYTVRTAPYAIVVGSQDQGYQKATAPGAGVQSFAQAISGDYAHLSSGNNGGSVWMVYPGFAQVDTTPGSPGQGGLRSWYFGDYNFRDWLFLAPLAADPWNPSRASLGGGNLNSTGHHVVQLTLSGGTITATQDALDLGNQVTALAYSPVIAGERYAVAGGRLFRDTGSGWQARGGSLPGGQYFYGNAIAVDPTVAGRLYIGGSGYSSPSVYVSNDDGATFQPMSVGLPDTLVYGLAVSPDGTMLFAATEVGAFWHDPAQNLWVDLTTPGAPEQVYWHVDVVPQLGIARFSTYGRGLWDFATSGLGGIFSNGFE